MAKKSTKVNTDEIVATVVGDAAADLKAQEDYERRHGADDLTILIGRSFVLGMRRNGYKNTATAVDEFADNALQAGASRIDVVFGYDGSTDSTHPSQIAVIDNGHGMTPGMIRLAMMWGGSHRAERDDRSGFGRFGFGLPTAALSQGEAYTVFSRTTKKAPFYGVEFDTRKLGTYASANGALQIPSAEETSLPQWLQQHVDKHFAGLPNGTIVMLHRLDNLTWKKRETLRRELAWHLGLYYRNFLSVCKMHVDGEDVQAIDPLFLTEGALYYDLDEKRASALPRATIPIKNPETGETQGALTVRYSYMPYGFAGDENEEDSRDGKRKRAKPNARFAILKQNPGIVVTRHGRQIDVIDIPKASDGWWEFIHRDYHWGCEIDFPATLDEEFNVTTSKQGVKPSPRMWQYLADHVRPVLLKMKRDREDERRVKQKPSPKPEEAAEAMVADVAQKWRRKPLANDPERVKRAIENLEREVAKRAQETGVPEREVAQAMVEQIKRRPFKVQRISEREGPFYRVDAMPGQAILLLNTAHPFYDEIYYPASDQLKTAFLLLLGALTMAEAGAPTEYQSFYVRERNVWSGKLTDLLVEFKEFNWPSLEDDSGEELSLEDAEQRSEVGQILADGLSR